MAKSTRKFAALFLTLALSFAFSIPTLAAEIHDHDYETDAECEGDSIGTSVSPLRACISHTWQHKSTLVPYGGIYISATICQSCWKETRICIKCGVTEFIRNYYIASDMHHVIIYSASCNGTTQTWLNKCNKCGHSMPTTTKKCPGGPHGGVCGYLPF